MTTKPHIRWMIRRDMAEVMEIEQLCFEYPWTEAELVNALRGRNVIGLVVEVENYVAGFMVYELFRKRLHIHTLAIMPRFQGKGMGRAFVSKLRDKLDGTIRTHLTTQVRESNLDAQLFLKSCGFCATEVRRGEYQETDEDAYVMRMDYQPIAECVGR